MDLTRETLVHATEAEWLAARANDLTSTECAALFDASPYATAFELHHRKAGTLPAEEFAANDRMKWGNRLEAAIAAGVAEDLGLIVEPFKVYMRIPELRMGSSFDFKIVGLAEDFAGETPARELFRKHGPGIMEVKNVDGLAFRRSWIDDGEVIEAPAHIEFQTAHQMEVADLNWAIIAPLVGGNTPRPILRERDAALCEAIRSAIASFWRNVDLGRAPAPDFNDDAGTISRLFAQTDGEELDLSTNNRLVELCMERAAASDQEKDAAKRKEAATAEILTIIGAAKKVRAAGGFVISAPTIAGGYVSFERKPHRRLTISNKAA